MSMISDKMGGWGLRRNLRFFFRRLKGGRGGGGDQVLDVP